MDVMRPCTCALDLLYVGLVLLQVVDMASSSEDLE